MKRQVSIILISYNQLAYTKDCLQSIKKYTPKDQYEIIIVDNASDEETKSWLQEQSEIKVIFNEQNVGFPAACNQGIAIANPKNDILLLNNDTIVTSCWLENLSTCLHSQPIIGAAGAVCNHNENLQGASLVYDDFETMQALAKENNVSDASRWEEKAFLIGFCLLIKREVIDKIKCLDEAYSPGYVEDNDLSLQIIEQGYRLMLCHDCFIHHYLGSSFRKDLTSFYTILNKNRDYFQKKWGFHTFAFDEMKEASFYLLQEATTLLEINCGIGITLLQLQYKYPNLKIDGIEANPHKADIASHFAHTIFPSLEAAKNNTYDCILIGTTLEEIDNPQDFIKQLKNYLTKDGYIIGEIHNMASLKNINLLLTESWYERLPEQRHYFTIQDIQTLFANEGYQDAYIFSWCAALSEEEQKQADILQQLVERPYDRVYYTFRFRK